MPKLWSFSAWIEINLKPVARILYTLQTLVNLSGLQAVWQFRMFQSYSNCCRKWVVSLLLKPAFHDLRLIKIHLIQTNQQLHNNFSLLGTIFLFSRIGLSIMDITNYGKYILLSQLELLRLKNFWSLHCLNHLPWDSNAQKCFPARPNPTCTSSAIHTPPASRTYLNSNQSVSKINLTREQITLYCINYLLSIIVESSQNCPVPQISFSIYRNTSKYHDQNIDEDDLEMCCKQPKITHNLWKQRISFIVQFCIWEFSLKVKWFFCRNGTYL